MKIAFFSDCYLDLTGGIISVINAEKAELERRGHTVYVFSSAYPRSDKAKKNLAKHHIFPVPSHRFLLRGITPIARRPSIVIKYLKKNFPELADFDVFYVHYEASVSIAGLKLAKFYNIPSIQMMHGREDVGETNLIPYGLRTLVATLLDHFHAKCVPVEVKISRDNYLASRLAHAKMWEIMVRQANFADLVLTPSRHFRAKLLHYGVTRPIKVLPNGLPDELIPPKVQPKSYDATRPLKIIWHNRLSAEKRMMPFLHALTKVKGPYILEVYGGGGDYFRAKRFAKNHHLNAHFHNTTPFDTIYKKLAQSDLDVLVSYNFDTFGMTLIEAQSVGVPVLIADPDLKEIVPAGSYLLSSTPTPDAMADALNQLFTHPAKIQQMSKIMLKNRDNIKISTNIDEFEKLVKNLQKSLAKE